MSGLLRRSVRIYSSSRFLNLPVMDWLFRVRRVFRGSFLASLKKRSTNYTKHTATKDMFTGSYR